MKKELLFIFFIFSLILYAQEEHPPLYFDYDSSGNQTLSDLVCVNCEDADQKGEENIDEEVTEEIYAHSNLSYYPNPTEEELIVNWENTINSRITAIKVYAFSGKLVASKINLNQENQLRLSFGDKATGIYNVEVLDHRGMKKTFKVIKK